MLRLSFALRRLRTARIPCATYTTAAEPSSLHRIVRVENLPEGYNVSSIISSVNANPSEAVIPSKDHILIRFLDERSAKRSLDIQTVAMLAKYNATRTIKLRKVPETFTESQFNEILSKHGRVVSSCFDKSEGVIEAQFLDLHQAFKARDDFVAAGALPRFAETEPFIYPEWYSKSDEQPNQERFVKIDGLKDIETRLMSLRWTNNYKEIPPAAFISARYSSEKTMSVYFPTSALARQFKSICEPLAAGKCTLSLHSSDEAVSRGVVTAIDQGARRLVAVPFNGTLTDEKRTRFGRFFHNFGRLDARRITHTDGQLIVPFATVVGASSYVYHVYKGLRIKPPSGIKNVLPTFVGAYHSG
ncbi:uncharacterized protein EV420DRAFT_1562256 [Desarmillaria tabescens]|uniref:Uncharacterized protein n=1 Tax=Armillaria tabescens TaxID=1929756 RepID=A0AA39MY71_ARMTA|nr:uncharacterized protein EV420DRAFT_1562256 [Desarmillaria tabescens]KAK0450543.1 hypothetical protein EV420DRAFT_1562256 [Desarmillaria tabescens]